MAAAQVKLARIRERLLPARDEIAQRIGLTQFEHRVVDRVAFAVEHAADDTDVLSRAVRVGHHRGEQAAKVVAVLLRGQPVGEVGPDGL